MCCGAPAGGARPEPGEAPPPARGPDCDFLEPKQTSDFAKWSPDYLPLELLTTLLVFFRRQAAVWKFSLITWEEPVYDTNTVIPERTPC